MILDEFVFEADAQERHSLRIPASLGEVRVALRGLEFADISPLVKVLVAIRGLPILLFAKGAAPKPESTPPLLAAMAAGGFVSLADTPTEIVMGLVGEPWKLVRPTKIRLADAEEFRRFNDPHFAKIGFNFTLEEIDGGTRLTTETRVRIVDPVARRKFLWYWFFIRGGSGLIRRFMLRAVARKAVAHKAVAPARRQATVPLGGQQVPRGDPAVPGGGA